MRQQTKKRVRTSRTFTNYILTQSNESDESDNDANSFFIERGDESDESDENSRDVIDETNFNEFDLNVEQLIDEESLLPEEEITHQDKIYNDQWAELPLNTPIVPSSNVTLNNILLLLTEFQVHFKVSKNYDF